MIVEQVWRLESRNPNLIIPRFKRYSFDSFGHRPISSDRHWSKSTQSRRQWPQAGVIELMGMDESADMVASLRTKGDGIRLTLLIDYKNTYTDISLRRRIRRDGFVRKISEQVS